MQQVHSVRGRWKLSLVVLPLLGGLSGCGSALKAMAENNQTPESLGISTTENRGQSWATGST
jgi:ABC-type branched-subunit amino acid transport system permease subunit